MARINVYIPDDLEEQLKAAGTTFNVSGICQHALREELALQASIDDIKHEVHELSLEDRDGNAYTGRLIGEQIAEAIYLTAEGRFVFYDDRKQHIDVIEHVEDLRGALDQDTYIEVMNRLNLTPVVDLDL